jgi:hypothetical protein
MVNLLLPHSFPCSRQFLTKLISLDEQRPHASDCIMCMEWLGKITNSTSCFSHNWVAFLKEGKISYHLSIFFIITSESQRINIILNSPQNSKHQIMLTGFSWPTFLGLWCLVRYAILRTSSFQYIKLTSIFWMVYQGILYFVWL